MHRLLLILFAAASFLLPHSVRAACDTSGLPNGTVVVEFTLTNGTLCLEMLSDDAPINVANFLYYVENGEYDGSLFHRHVPGFVLQGGDQRRDGMGGWETIPKKDDQDVQNEPCTLDTPAPTPTDPNRMICSVRGNERGTIAAAKIMDLPDSASTNFFINLVDNRGSLDNQNGGFTVYARVMGDGMDLVDTYVPTNSYQKQAIASELATFVAVALMAPQGVGGYVGCFDPNGTAAVVIEPSTALLSPATGKLDPRDPASFPWFISPACSATLVPDPTTFVANACSGAFTSMDEMSVQIDPITVTTGAPMNRTFFRHTCAAVDEFLAAVDAARLDPTYQAAYASQVVYIESATKIVVPEAGTGAQWASAITLLVATAARRRARRP